MCAFHLAYFESGCPFMRVRPLQGRTVHPVCTYVFRRYNSNTKKISYEDDFHLPDSGSLVQGVSVDPHSAVFGRNGQRLDDKPEAADLLQPNGLPDVTGYYHKNSNGGTFLSSFQPNPSRLHGDEEPQRPLWPGGKKSKSRKVLEGQMQDFLLHKSYCSESISV